VMALRGVIFLSFTNARRMPECCAATKIVGHGLP
jgi:hypothetical protein